MTSPSSPPKRRNEEEHEPRSPPSERPAAIPVPVWRRNANRTASANWRENAGPRPLTPTEARPWRPTATDPSALTMSEADLSTSTEPSWDDKAGFDGGENRWTPGDFYPGQIIAAVHNTHVIEAHHSDLSDNTIYRRTKHGYVSSKRRPMIVVVIHYGKLQCCPISTWNGKDTLDWGQHLETQRRFIPDAYQLITHGQPPSIELGNVNLVLETVAYMRHEGTNLVRLAEPVTINCKENIWISRNNNRLTIDSTRALLTKWNALQSWFFENSMTRIQTRETEATGAQLVAESRIVARRRETQEEEEAARRRADEVVQNNPFQAIFGHGQEDDGNNDDGNNDDGHGGIDT